MARPLAVGDVIHGFARGVFGRDHHNCVRIEAAGVDWIVARDSSSHLAFASGWKALTILIQVRDEDSCPDGVCSIESAEPPLTVPGGW